MNKVILMGRLTKDPEVRYTQTNNTLVASFSLAVNRRFARPGEERQADFINIVAWRQTAEFVAKYFQKGSAIGIEGSIQTRKYTDKDGKSRTAFEVVANNVHFIESKNSGGANTPAVQNNTSDFTEEDPDSDLPF